jgi:hypothetical protein
MQAQFRVRLEVPEVVEVIMEAVGKIERWLVIAHRGTHR